MIKCIIFDLDGTLLDTLDDIKDSINESLISFSYTKQFVKEDIKYFIGSGVNTLIKKACDAASTKQEDIPYILKKYNEIYITKRINETKPYENVEDTLLKLKELGLKLCVLSNKPDIDTKACISHYFKNMFDIVLGQREGYKIKPDPNGIFEIMNKLNFQKEEVIYVGDMYSDIETCRNAGIEIIGAKYGYATEDIFKNERFVISSFKDIINVIKEINYDN